MFSLRLESMLEYYFNTLLACQAININVAVSNEIKDKWELSQSYFLGPFLLMVTVDDSDIVILPPFARFCVLVAATAVLNAPRMVFRACSLASATTFSSFVCALAAGSGGGGGDDFFCVVVVTAAFVSVTLGVSLILEVSKFVDAVSFCSIFFISTLVDRNDQISLPKTRKNVTIKMAIS